MVINLDIQVMGLMSDIYLSFVQDWYVFIWIATISLIGNSFYGCKKNDPQTHDNSMNADNIRNKVAFQKCSSLN